jgi:hypothetical protein
MCEKLHFMQLKLKELELNQRLWKAFEYSRQGDFMANFSKKDLSQFQKCGKNAIWTPSQLHELKAVSACMSRSQELCRNYRDGKARFQNEDVLSDKEYMLGNFSVEELETMRRSYGDPWVKRALKNREREPVYSRQQLICEKGPRQEVIVQKQLPPENKEGLESKVGTINMGGLGTGDGGLVDTRSGNQLGGVASSTPDPVTGVAGYSGRLPATSGNIPRETGVVHGRTALRGGKGMADSSESSDSLEGKAMTDWSYPTKSVIEDPVKPNYSCSKFLKDMTRLLKYGEVRYERKVMEKWYTLPFESLDTETHYFVKTLFRSASTLSRRWDFDHKVEYFLRILARICRNKLPQKIRFSNSPCNRMKQYTGRLEKQWLQSKDFNKFKLEVNDYVKIMVNENEKQNMYKIMERIRPDLGFRTKKTSG